MLIPWSYLIMPSVSEYASSGLKWPFSSFKKCYWLYDFNCFRISVLKAWILALISLIVGGSWWEHFGDNYSNYLMFSSLIILSILIFEGKVSLLNRFPWDSLTSQGWVVFIIPVERRLLLFFLPFSSDYLINLNIFSEHSKLISSSLPHNWEGISSWLMTYVKVLLYFCF